MIALTRPECPNPDALAKRNYRHEENKEALRKPTHGKCMYCEGKMEPTSYSDIEHIKPKSKFPELEFAWENLGFACQRCNRNKGAEYNETEPLINPYDENPEDYIYFWEWFAKPVRGSSRGEYTIRKLDLNRIGLVETRQEKFEDIEKLIKILSGLSDESLRNQLITEIRKEAKGDQEYSAMVRCALAVRRLL